MSKRDQTIACPCGGIDYAHCCGRYIDGDEVPQSAEQLMRSRYTAFTQANESYLRKTWYPRTLPQGRLISSEPGLKWVGLTVRDHGQSGDEASVEFVARYKVNGRAQRLHEVSRFVREEGRWFYLDGVFPEGAA